LIYYEHGRRWFQIEKGNPEESADQEWQKGNKHEPEVPNLICQVIHQPEPRTEQLHLCKSTCPVQKQFSLTEQLHRNISWQRRRSNKPYNNQKLTKIIVDWKSTGSKTIAD
jgi:hypothetical protein